jgi:hypothetical protein
MYLGAAASWRSIEESARVPATAVPLTHREYATDHSIIRVLCAMFGMV